MPKCTRAIRRAGIFLFLSGLGLVVAGCSAFQSRPSVQPETGMEDIASRLEYIAQFHEQLQQGIEHLEQLHQQYTASAFQTVGEDSFPMSLYQLVVMSCLNEEFDLYQMPDSSDDNLGSIRCNSPFLGELIRALEDVPLAKREHALLRLKIIDALRASRSQLRRQIQRIPQESQEHQAFVVDKRGEYRQLQAEIARRRPGFTQHDGATLDEHYALLDELDRAIDALEHSYLSWQKLLNDRLQDVYMNIAGEGTKSKLVNERLNF